MHLTKIMRYGLAGILLSSSVSVPLTRAHAQEKDDAKPAETKRVRDGGRDPFKRFEAPRILKRASGQVLAPSIQERIAQYKAQKVAAMNARMAPPKPTTALLLSELQVIGISRSPRGYAAIVEATPIKLSYVIYPGERFYDGQLVAIEDNRLVFRREIVFVDGRHDRTVEIKSLRQPSAADLMTSAQSAPAGAPVPDSGSEQRNAVPIKP